MSNPPSESSQSQSSTKQKTSSNQLPLLLGAGFFGLVGIGLLASVWNLMGDNKASQTTTTEVVTSAPEASRPPATPEEHQQLVTQVVNDLERDVLVGDSPTLGNPDADVVLLEFSDFQCPYCARATGHIEEFTSEYGDDVLFVFKNFPLTNIHPEALPAAQAAWAAGQQDQFWPYHDALFESQAVLGERLYVDLARELGLDMDQFNRDRASEDAMKAVARDLALASELQLSSTPTFVMNDVLIPGAVPAEFFAEALERIQATQ
ncbi:thioredoxin domain-containing protein [Oscillatoria sp. CS-180]|uniref:DsbA family protein n=1 Tax=Oscillatoria sp. CS-180 TaxID=3021720 RepID=UPI00232DD7E1|nr:thioredoxin domain-containing protein [Oscillatoria sp. CS-180]MDB9529805.1 thioredoxin domain-containing protein [Oscillatoria sp. CS-180]